MTQIKMECSPLALILKLNEKTADVPGRYVDLQNPRLQVLVQQDIESEQFVDTVPAATVGLNHTVDG